MDRAGATGERIRRKGYRDDRTLAQADLRGGRRARKVARVLVSKPEV